MSQFQEKIIAAIAASKKSLSPEDFMKAFGSDEKYIMSYLECPSLPVEIRVLAATALGFAGSRESSEALVSVYVKTDIPELKQACKDAIFAQGVSAVSAIYKLERDLRDLSSRINMCSRPSKDIAHARIRSACAIAYPDSAKQHKISTA